MLRRIVACVLILALLGGTSLWAVVRGRERGRNYNRDLQKRSGHANWARCIGLDSDGPMTVSAYIEVDRDLHGVDYSAYASVSGTGYHGTYSLYADVPGDDSDSDSGDVEGYTYSSVSSSDFDWWARVNAEDALANCSAHGEISGATSQSDPYLHRSRAEAWKFPVKGRS